MADLTVHEVLWCVQHGHPVLTLRMAACDRFFAVAMTADDAAAFADWPSSGAAAARVRLYGLLEATIAGLGARPTEVRLHVGPDNVLRAALRVEGPGGELILPAHFADGIVLARRARLPLRMADEDVARVPLATIPRPAEPEPDPTPLGPFRDLIESLDLDGLGGRD